MKVLTHQKRIQWGWATIILLPWFTNVVREQISATGITFTLKKFTDDPMLIGLIGSSNQAFGFIIGAMCSYTSDHIWTRFGRRRPFLIVGFVGSAFLCLLIPTASHLWSVVVVILLYQAVVDFGSGLYEPLTMELIPSHQRGRAGAIVHALKALAFGVVFAGLIGGFDKVYRISENISVTGEQVMYWFNSGGLMIAGIIIIFLVKETKIKGTETRRFRDVPYTSLFKALASPTILPLLGLAFVLQNLWSGIGQYEPLLVTEQWGYTKSQYGNIMSISMIITVFVVPVGGWFSDRFDRLVLLKYGLSFVLLMKFGFYVYAEYVAPNGIPPFHMVLALGLFKGAIGSFMAVACVPLIFDFVSANRLGTLSCGMGMTFSLVTAIGINAIGAWIKVSSSLVYGLPENTYNYMAGYHWLFIFGLLGLAYLQYFERLTKSGRLKKISVLELEDGPEKES